MYYEKLSLIALDHLDFICYISDVDTYELLFLNKKTKELFGFNDEKDYVMKKCYEVLQNKSEPCEFCTNHLLKEDEYLKWNHFNESAAGYYALSDTLILSENRRLRLETATDITPQYDKINNLQTKLTVEETLVRCVQTLAENISVDDAINRLLAVIGEYYNSDRAYIFEFDYVNNVLNNTYEWCKSKINKQIENLQKIPLSNIDSWVEKFNDIGEFYISQLDIDVDKTTPSYQILYDQGIDSLIAAPLILDGKIVGFVGVDNPKLHANNAALLRSLTLFILNDLTKGRLYYELEKISYCDALTGLHNRNKYTLDLKILENSPPKKLGIIYADINGLKTANDMYGHDYGDYYIKKNAQNILDVFGAFAYRIGGDEFVCICPNISQKEFEKRIKTLRSLICKDSECSLSIGSVWHEGSVDILKAIAAADKRMYEEKQSYYKTMLTSQSNIALSAEQDLQTAISNGEFDVFFQSQFNLITSEISAISSIIRKKDADGEYIFNNFMSKYEDNNIADALDFYVLNTICDKISTLNLSPSTPFFIKISNSTLLDDRKIYELFEICTRHNVPTNMINLEISENSSILSIDILKERIKLIKNLGFSISLRDFGAKSINIELLSEIDFTNIKIDKSLIDKISQSTKSDALLEGIIEMCDVINECDVIAVGISTNEQLEFLRDSDCLFVEGDFLSMPVPIDEYFKKIIV